MLIAERGKPTVFDDGSVVAIVKTPLLPKPTMARLPGTLTLKQAVDQLLREQPKDANAARVLQQLQREMSDAHHFLAVKPTGVEQVDPLRTTLNAISVPREIRTPQGVDKLPVASWEVQSYAKVGVSDC